MDATDNRTRIEVLALAAGLDRAMMLSPEEIARAVAMVAEQRAVLGAIDDPAIGPA